MTYKPLILHQDNPFKESIEKRIETTVQADNGMLLNEEVTMVRRRQYLKGPGWVKLTQDKELFLGLSPWACQIIVYMAMNLEPNQEKMKFDRKEIGMDWRKYSQCMLELLSRRIIAETGKRQWYWINVGLLIFGTVNKHE